MKKILLILIFISNLIAAQTTPDLGQVLEVDNNGYQLGISNINNIIGGTSTTSSLTFKTTTGVGTTGADHIFQVGNNGATEAMRILNNGNVGIGTIAPSARLNLISTTEQLRSGYDANNYVSHTIGSTGITTIIGVGTASAITIVGGNQIGSTVNLRSTTAIGTALGQAVRLFGGNNGATTIAQFYNNGNVDFGTTAGAIASANINISKPLTGATNSYGVYLNPEIQSGVTTNARMILSAPSTVAASFNVSGLIHFQSFNAVLGAGSSVTTQTGFLSTDLTIATNNYGFRGVISSGTNKYNNYMDGTAQNYWAGNCGFGVVIPTDRLHIGAGTTALAPIILTSGPLTTGGNIRAGQIQFLTDAYYATITTGTAVKTFAFLESPIFTGTPSMPTGTTGITQSANNNSTKLATTAYVDAAIETSTIIYEATTTIISSEILNLYTTPKIISITVGAGQYVEVVSASATMTYNSSPYTTNTNLVISCVGATAYSFSNSNILESTVTRNVQFDRSSNVGSGTTYTQLIDGANLQISVLNGNPTAGNSNIKVKILFRIVTI